MRKKNTISVDDMVQNDNYTMRRPTVNSSMHKTNQFVSGSSYYIIFHA